MMLPPAFTRVRYSIPLCATAMLGMASLVFTSPSARAESIYWNATSGDWITLGNWASSPGGDAITAFPSTNPINYYLTNGVSGATATTTMTNAPGNRVLTDFQIGAFNTLLINGTSSSGSAGSPRVSGAFSNSGLIRTGSSALDYVRMELSWIAGSTASNSGTIEAAQGILHLQLGNGSMNNAGGLLLAKSGATLNLVANANSSVSQFAGGTLRSETGGLIQVGNYDVQAKLRLDGVTVDNQGVFTTLQNYTASAGGSRTVSTILNGATTFTNKVGGTVNLLNTGGGANPGAVTRLAASFELNDTASFNNQGLLNITNDTTRTGGSLTDNSLVFSVNSANSTFQNTGTIQVVNASTSTGATAAFTSVKSIVNEGTVRVQGTAQKNATFTITGSGGSYTQSGTGVRTLLELGGILSAEDVRIESGKLGGVGTVTAIDTVIGADASLVAGDTLGGVAGVGVFSMNSSLTFEDNSTAVLALGANTAGSGRVAIGAGFDLMIGEGVKISLLDLNGTAIAGTTYRLFELAGGTVSGSFVLDTIPENWEGSLTTGSNYVDFTLTSVAAVPEASSYALLASAAIAMTVLAKRRRRGVSLVHA